MKPLNELQPPEWKRPVNQLAWALCTKQGKRWHVRRIVWGIALAREERRHGETIKRACIVLREGRGKAPT